MTITASSESAETPTGPPSRSPSAAWLARCAYHPDVNNDFGAAEDFKRIRSAYETLADSGSRCAYDQALRMQSHARRDSTRNDRYSSMYKRGSQQMYSGHTRHQEWEKNNYGHIWEFYQKRSSDETNPKTRRIEYESDPDVIKDSSPLFVARDRAPTELLIIFMLVGFIWYTFGVQLALTYFAFFIPHNNDHTILYKFSSLVAWLIGGSRGIFLQYGIVTTGWLYGKDHDIVLAFLLSGLWIASNLPHAFHIPRGAILLMAYLALGTKGPSS